jgi:hypothetical protein
LKIRNRSKLPAQFLWPPTAPASNIVQERESIIGFVVSYKGYGVKLPVSRKNVVGPKLLTRQWKFGRVTIFPKTGLGMTIRDYGSKLSAHFCGHK